MQTSSESLGVSSGGDGLCWREESCPGVVSRSTHRCTAEGRDADAGKGEVAAARPPMSWRIGAQVPLG